MLSRRKQRLLDANLALIVLAVAFLLGLLIGRASAEEINIGACIKQESNTEARGIYKGTWLLCEGQGYKHVVNLDAMKDGLTLNEILNA